MEAGYSGDEPGSRHPPARVWRDWALVGVLVPAAVLEVLLRADLPWRPVALAIGVGLVPTLLWRRTRPLLMVAIAFGTGIVASLATPGESPQPHVTVYFLLLPYALARWGEGRAVPAGRALAAAAGGVSACAHQGPAGDGAGGFAVLVATVAVGAAFRFRARARARELEQVKLVERERLARDLHDTVAHHVSAIAIRAQAGLVTAPTRPDAAVEALRVIETEARRTLAEMRAMVRVLRQPDGADGQPARPGRGPSGEPPGRTPGPRDAASDQPPAPLPEDLAPSPGIADVERLADDDRAGPPVEVRVAGELGRVAPPVAAAIYRLAQESVTNARRHARGATRIEVDVTADETAVRLRVRDDGHAGAAQPAPAGGYGLLGMRERAHLLGGTFEAGPVQDSGRGWAVTAVLPRTGPGAPA
ncbi:sensor histidine kinase [Frankia nepalensis]|uniref:sensor histidine kinase n=1 Tax=Frankia nepalensis TaxID=1836974 RepID=UPI001934A536|nr:histidine kinase [Frankia nepalensis]